MAHYPGDACGTIQYTSFDILYYYKHNIVCRKCAWMLYFKPKAMQS